LSPVRGLLFATLLGLTQTASAQDIDRSPRPPANPRLMVPAAMTEPQPLVAAEGAPETVPEVAAPTDIAALPDGAIERSMRPVQRSAKLAERIGALMATSNAPGFDLSSTPEVEDLDLAAVPPPTRKEERKKKREKASMKGAVCGVPAIKGEEIAPIGSKITGCGVADAVMVTSVAGVRLSQAATVDCSIAKALNAWVDDVAQPAFDGKLVEMTIAAHYICRSRNNVKGAKISEHGKGRAIDISGFILSNGKILTVEGNYNKLLRRIYKAACGFFSTTLGPGSDGYHEDHFHFDTSARKGGAYCR
jgi:hypothetical protein